MKIEPNEFQRALWNAVSDTMRATDRNCRAGGIDALRVLLEKMRENYDKDSLTYLYLTGELDRLEAF